MSATAPTGSSGLVWYDTSTGATYIYYNSTWVELGAGTMSPLPATSSTYPVAPWTGQTVYDVDTNKLYVWNGSAWVIPNSPAQNPQGLELITTATCSSGGTGSGGVIAIGLVQSSVTVANAFSSNYDNYKILIQNTSSSTLNGVRLQLASSTGSTYSTANMNIAYSSASVTPEVASNATQWSIGTGQGLTSITLDLISPFLATDSQVMAQSSCDTFVSWRSGRDSADLSSTGFVLSLTSGTITGGTIRIYGYRNS
jgi:hypothetical protein